MKSNGFKYVVVGGGTAGWLTALFINQQVPYSDVTVVASSELGILGAGEGVTPAFIDFLKKIDISPHDIIKYARATVKHGIKFVNWTGDGGDYYHPFFSTVETINVSRKICDNERIYYNKQFEKQDIDALHFDARLLAKYLEKVGVERGIKLIDGEVQTIVTKGDGNIEALLLNDGLKIDLDFVFDCSGFKRVIIGNHFKSKWNSYKSMLPVDRAIPFFIENNDKIPPYTEAIAMKYGWMWKIPVQGRYGCGYAFDSSYISDAAAIEEIEEYLGHSIVVPTTFSFNAGCYEKTWINNCVAIGLSTGFSEPLEATSIWVQTASLKLFLKKINGLIFNDKNSVAEYNNMVYNMNYDVANFLYFHYLTPRDDSKFWKEFKQKTNASEMIKRFINKIDSGIPTYNDIESFSRETSPKTTSSLKTFDEYSWYIIAEGIKCFSAGLNKNVDVNLNDYVTHEEYINYARN